VDAATGERRTFTRDTGVGLVDAIAASSAFPTVYPPVRIQDRLYLDGSVASLVNADLAVGADRVVVLAPFLLRHVHRRTVEDELATLRPAVRSVVVTADRRCRRIMGGAIFDRARVPATLSAARAQAADVVAAVAPVWQRDAGGVG